MKLNAISIKYYYNDRYITCKISWQYAPSKGKRFSEFFLKYLPMKFPMVKFYVSALFFTTTGTAKCAEGDTYDELTGKRIAESKASIKAFDLVSRMMRHYESTLNHYLHTAVKEVGRFTMLLHKEGLHLQKLS